MDRRVGFESLNDEAFQSQLKAKYKSKVFIGSYFEKRLVIPLKCYRDFIQIDENEKEFAKDLESMLAELSNFYRGQVFVGIAKPDENFTLCTELEEETAFGKYWFQVRRYAKIIAMIHRNSIFR